MEDVETKKIIIRILDICERIAISREALKKSEYNLDETLLHDVESLLQVRLYALINELTLLKRCINIPFAIKTPNSEIFFLIEPLYDYLVKINNSQKERTKIYASLNEDIQKMFAKWWASPDHKFRFNIGELDADYHPNKYEIGIFSFVGLINIAIKHKYGALYQEQKSNIGKALDNHYHNHFENDKLDSSEEALDEFENRYNGSKMSFVAIGPRRKRKTE